MMQATWLALLVLTASCRAGGDRPVSAKQAEELAIANASEALPQVPWRTRMTITTEDIGARWRVTFSPAPGSTGDPVSLEVDKNTGQVVKGMKGPCYIDARRGWKNPCQFDDPARAFSNIDSNKNGAIDRREWNHHAAVTSAELGDVDSGMKKDFQDQTALLFETLDANSDQRVSGAEWERAVEASLIRPT